MRPFTTILFLTCAVTLVGCQEAERQQPNEVHNVPNQIVRGIDEEQLLKNLLRHIEKNDEGTDRSITNDGEFRLAIDSNTEYYKSCPQQSQPPDGTFKTGTKVTPIHDAGSYTLIRSADGVEAYVATDALKKIQNGVNLDLNEEYPDLTALVKGNNQFAFDLYARLRTEPRNLFFSPNSLSIALAMTYAGAKGDTETQMANVLHFDLPQHRLHLAFSALVDRLYGKKKGIEVRFANRLWGQVGYDFLPEYLQETRDQYGAELGQVDFVQQTDAARQAINTWVEEQTKNKIKDLFPTGAFDERTRLVLANAIYFKGDWASQFNKTATKNAPFHISADDKVNVPMMFQKQEFAYGVFKEVQILEFPYIGYEMSMLVVLPNEVEGLSSIEEKLTPDHFDKWSSALRKQEVDVYLPKFRMTSEFSLGSILKAMGMTAAFDFKQADFSGMTGNQELYIKKAVHKAFVDVNEEGTEAAAATEIGIIECSLQIPPTFRADHPFIFMIRDNQTGSILFMGRVMNPKR